MSSFMAAKAAADKKRETDAALSLATGVINFACFPLRGFVLWCLWAWLLVPSCPYIREITFAESLGLIVVFRALDGYRSSPPIDGIEQIRYFFAACGQVLAYTILLGVGYVVSLSI